MKEMCLFACNFIHKYLSLCVWAPLAVLPRHILYSIDIKVILVSSSWLGWDRCSLRGQLRILEIRGVYCLYYGTQWDICSLQSNLFLL